MRTLRLLLTAVGDAPSEGYAVLELQPDGTWVDIANQEPVKPSVVVEEAEEWFAARRREAGS